MKFEIDGLDVFFPYDFLYAEQYKYMRSLKQAIDAKGHCLLEMPTGTGKTVCLIALITSYQFAHPEVGKLVYCTRTVPEMQKCMEEVEKVISYRKKIIGEEGGKILAVCLSSRRNMCIHPRGKEESERDEVDTICRSMTSSWIRQTPGKELCSFYEDYDKNSSEAEIPYGVYNLENLKEFGAKKNWCPYFLTRNIINRSNIIVFNYQYMLDPKVSNLVTRTLEQESIVVFDEGHNIDNICIEALSVTLDRKSMEASSRAVRALETKVKEMKSSDAARLNAEYQALISGLADQGQGQHIPDTILANPLLPQDILEEAVPGNIRKAEHFVVFLKRVVEYLKKKIKGGVLDKSTPLAFLYAMQEDAAIDRKSLRFTYTRLNSLLRTLQITSIEDFGALLDASNFVTLLSTYLEGFSVIFEPEGSIVSGVKEPLLQLCCLDASLAIKPVFERFNSVTITSGTLSPIDLYPKILNFNPRVRTSLSMSTFRPCLLPLVVTRGSDQTPLTTRFESRGDESIVRNYGQLLLDVCKTVPDGICCFFTSYMYMEIVVGLWDEMKILQQVMDLKLIFLETKDVVETTLALDNFKRACDCGRGAVFLSVARGKVAEGIDFDRHYGRCVLLFGVPYQYTQSHVLQARLEFMRTNYQIKENDFLTFDAMRQSAQCIGRVIRSKTDYGIVVLADSRFNRLDKRSKFPPWITQFISDTSSLNLSTDLAIEQMKSFLRELGQPIDQAALRSILVSEDQIQFIR